MRETPQEMAARDRVAAAKLTAHRTDLHLLRVLIGLWCVLAAVNVSDAAVNVIAGRWVLVAMNAGVTVVIVAVYRGVVRPKLQLAQRSIAELEKEMGIS